MNSEIKPKIIFMGTPEFGVIVLEGLIKNGYKPVLIITVSDKPVGRKQILTPPPVKVLAEKYKIPVVQPKKILYSKDEILNLKPDLVIIAGYNQILPKEFLEIPKYGCLNVHPSLLPKHRGASPIQAAILNGDEETGVTIILMDEQVDHGPVLAQRKTKVELTENTKQLHDKLAILGAELLIEIIPDWIKGKIRPQQQEEKKATYTKILKREDGKIDWKKSAQELERQIRAFDDWPGSFFEVERSDLNFKKVKVIKASVLEQKEVGPFGVEGKTFIASNDKIAVQTGKDFLIIEELKPEGRRKMTAKEFLNGHPEFIGIILL